MLLTTHHPYFTKKKKTHHPYHHIQLSLCSPINISENDYSKYISTMSFSHWFTAFLFSLIVCLVISECHADVNANASHISKLVIDAGTRRPIPDTFFGAFFEVNYNMF